MSEMDTFINDLSAQPAPTCRAHCLMKLFLTWAGVLILYIAAVVGFYLLPRPDLLQKLTQPLFAAEILSLGAMIFSSAFGAALLGYPDGQQKPWALWLPLAAFAVFVIIIAFAWHAYPLPPTVAWDGMKCTLCIALLSLPPVLFMSWQIRRMASVRPRLAAVNAFLAAFAVAALALRLSEPTDSMMHLAIFHYLPMLAAAALGCLIGRRIFRW